jgi:Domain of unknown function (DUF6431)
VRRLRLHSGAKPGKAASPVEPHTITILFISCSGEDLNPPPDWALATTDGIVRSCPTCQRESIIGHGRRSKQAHDDTHNRIPFRRGICRICRTTFSFLPWFSLPYTHYSLFARSQALRFRFVEQRGWEAAAPQVKDPDRVAAPSTVRRWFVSLDSSPSFSFLRKTLAAMSEQLDRGEPLAHRGLQLSWRTVATCLHVLWPLRL